MKFTVLGAPIIDQSELPNQGVSSLTAAATIPVNMSGTAVATLTPTGNCTLNASGGVNNQIAILIVTTTGTTSFTVTFGTNFKSQGTLATGTVAGKVFTLKFVCNAGTWSELSRTTAM